MTIIAEYNSGTKLVLSHQKLRRKANLRQNSAVPQLIKQGQRMYSVATPDTQLLATSTSKTTERSLNNLQIQKITALRTLSMPKHTLLKRLYINLLLL